jgi:hypothetical protein
VVGESLLIVAVKAITKKLPPVVGLLLEVVVTFGQMVQDVGYR